MGLVQLDKPYATIQAYDSRVQITTEGRDELARNIIEMVYPARQDWLDALKGTCVSCQDQTIIERELAFSGSVPIAFTQSMMRVLTTAQYLISWAYERLGQLENRENDKNKYQPQYDAMWSKNLKNAFYMMDTCQWDSSMALTCTSSTRKATKTFRFQNGTAVTPDQLSVSDSTQSLPTHGSDHPEWSFNFSCNGHGYPIGMKGDTNHPNGDSSHYIAGFQLHCSDGFDTIFSGHHLTDGDSNYFDFKFQKPFQKMTGCVNRPSGDHHITYWASKCTLSSHGDTDLYTIDAGTDGCSGGGDPIHYTIDCGTGSVMQHFSGASDVPDGHTVSYIAQMDIICVPWITASTVTLV